MSSAEQILLEAAKLPPNDAAFWLWINKDQLDRETQTPPPAARKADLNDPGVFAKIVKTAIAHVLWEQENASDGPTFDRMKTAHPEASDRELKRSIKAAIKLYQDCCRYCSNQSQSPNIFGVATAAIESAKRENPGFSEDTYRRAQFEMLQAMR
jgi:hypothetical protein